LLSSHLPVYAAMNGMGFNRQHQQSIFSVVSTLLHASNVSFSVSSSDESKVDFDNPHLKYVTDLLGLNVDTFNDALCAIYIQVGKERHRKIQPKHKAEKGLEALIKAIYTALFKHIVEEINTSFACKKRGKDGVASFIGVLDIFGFESFKTNSLEQLFINYCNEALQQQFNAFVFKLEQEVYRREGIDWSLIEFPDNQDVLDLIENKRTGLISVLDDQCRAPGTTDQSFASLLYRTCKNHTRLEADFRQVGKKLFGIKHYAGSVEYDTINFIEKNRDETPRETIELLKSSSKPFVKILLKQHEKTIASPQSSNRSFSKARQVTVGGQFKTQLQSLRQKIDKTTPHYVRCLKPNSDLVAGEFNSNMISAQLQSAGVLEAVRISRVGYSQRFSHDQFLKRYDLLDMEKMIAAKQKKVSTEDRCEILIKSVSVDIFDQMKMSLHGVQMGKTKVFLWQKHFDQLEYYRENKMTNSVTILQSQARMFIVRSYYLAAIRATIIIQNCRRRFLAVKLVKSMRGEKSSILIQSIVRRHLAMKLLRSIQQERSAIFIEPICENEIVGTLNCENENVGTLNCENENVGTLNCDNKIDGNDSCVHENRIDDNKNLVLDIECLDIVIVENERLKQQIKLMRDSHLEESLASTVIMERLQRKLNEQSHQWQELSQRFAEKDKELEIMTVENERLKQKIEGGSQLELNEPSNQQQESSHNLETKQEDLAKKTAKNDSFKEKAKRLLFI